MIQYLIKTPSTIDTDALLIDVDCVGKFAQKTVPQPSPLVTPDVVTAYRTAFDAGQIEPGRILKVDREGKRPQHVFLLPTRVHWNGAIRKPILKAGLDELLELVLREGIKSLAFSQLRSDANCDWPEIKLQMLTTFARVPDIKLSLIPSADDLSSLKQVVIFSDGGAEPNPGAGGYGTVLRFGESCKELSDGFQFTSNNRMELLGAIAGLEALKHPCHVRLHSDSRYVVDNVNSGFLFRLASKDWILRKAKNIDLWKRFLAAYLKHEVEMIWVKGHSGIADNERCDQLASAAVAKQSRQIDQGYVASIKKKRAGTTGQLFDNSQLSTPKQSVVAAAGASVPRGPKPKKVGDPCRNCHDPLIKRETKKHNPNAAYWYSWHLFCEKCRRIYHVEEAKMERG